MQSRWSAPARASFLEQVCRHARFECRLVSSPSDLEVNAASLLAACQRHIQASDDACVAVRRHALASLSSLLWGVDLCHDVSDAAAPGSDAMSTWDASHAAAGTSHANVHPSDAFLDADIQRALLPTPSLCAILEAHASLFREVLPSLQKPLLRRFHDSSDVSRAAAMRMVGAARCMLCVDVRRVMPPLAAACLACR